MGILDGRGYNRKSSDIGVVKLEYDSRSNVIGRQSGVSINAVSHGIIYIRECGGGGYYGHCCTIYSNAKLILIQKILEYNPICIAINI